jgi:hypothetical protein
MAPRGSHLNCPDGMCAARGSAANPVETVEEVLTLTGSKHFKDKALSIVAANGSYEWGGDLGQKRIDLPKNITHIICNEGLATFGRADDRRVIGLKNHPFLTAFGLVLHADIEANSDEGESVLNKVAGRLFGKYIVKAEKTGKLSVALDNITQVIEREHLRDDKWDNEAHVKDAANLIMKITNTNKTSFFGKALVMANGDGMLDASTEDGTIEDCGCSSFCEDKSKVRQITRRMKFLMRARGLLGAKEAAGADETREGYSTNTATGSAQVQHVEEENGYVCAIGQGGSKYCRQCVHCVETPERPTAKGENPIVSQIRNGNRYSLPEGTRLDNVDVKSGMLSMEDKGLAVAAEGPGILSQYNFGGMAQVVTTDNGSSRNAPHRHLKQSGSGDAQWKNSANGVNYTTAGSLEKYIDNFQYRKNNTGVTTRCDPLFGYNVEQNVRDAAGVFLSNNDPDEEVCGQPGKDSIYNMNQDGPGTSVEQNEVGGIRKFHLRADMGQEGEGAVSELVAIRNNHKDGKSTHISSGTLKKFIRARKFARASTTATSPKVPVIGISTNISGEGMHTGRAMGDIMEARNFGTGDTIVTVEGTDNANVRDFASGQTVTTDSSPFGEPVAFSRNFGDNATYEGTGTNNFGGVFIVTTSSSALVTLIETGAQAIELKLEAVGSGGLSGTFTNSKLGSLSANGVDIKTQLNNVEAEIAEFEGGQHNIANCIVDKVTSIKTKLTSAFSRFKELETDEGSSSTRYTSVTGKTSHKSGDHEHLFSQFNDKVELNHPDITKIMKFRSSQSQYNGDPTKPDEAAIVAEGPDGAKIAADFGAVQSGKPTLMEERDGAAVAVTVGDVVVPPGLERLKMKVSELRNKPNQAEKSS